MWRGFSSILFVLAIISAWAWSRWIATLPEYDLLVARSQRYVSGMYEDDHRSIENVPATWMPELYPSLNQSADGLRVMIVASATTGMMRCRTAAFTFSQKPRYRALSYEWGPPQHTLPINLNGLKVHVRENLWYALHHLRHPHKEISLFVDALCINQQDDAEKARLIPQMAMVYRRAEEVILWLDNHIVPPNLQVYFSQMAKWHEVPEEIDWYYHTAWWDEAVPWLYRLLHSRYWQRTWIIQEIEEAVRLKVHFPGGSLPWSSFIIAIQAFQKVFPYVTGTERIEILNSVRTSKQAGEIYSLSNLVCDFRDTFCTMPHDKVFAFLGMADDDSTSIIKAAYEQPLREIYHQFAQYLSKSTFDPVVKQVQMVHRSALLRYLLARKEGVISYPELTPCIADLKDDPYNYYFTTRDSNGKDHLEVGTDFRRKWKEWHVCTTSLQRSCWVPSPAEFLEDWRVANISAVSTLKARGSFAGEIEYLGPTIATFMGSGRAVREWRLSVRNHFSDFMAQKYAIALGERMIDFIIQPSAAEEISSIGSFCIYGECSPEQARFFIGSNSVLGLVSPTAQVGDFIIQFFNSTALAVVRPSLSGRTIVGRAGIVQRGYSHDWDIVDDISVFLESQLDRDSEEYLMSHTMSLNTSAVILDMDINTLTQLNLNSIHLQDGNHHPDCQAVAPVDAAGFLAPLSLLLSMWWGILHHDYLLPWWPVTVTLLKVGGTLFAMAYIQDIREWLRTLNG